MFSIEFCAYDVTNSLSTNSRKSFWRVFELKCNYLTCYFGDRAAVVQSTFKIANQCPFSSLLAYRVLLHGGDWIIWWLIDLTATRHRRLMESIFLRYIQTANRLDTSSYSGMAWLICSDFVKRRIREGSIRCTRLMIRRTDRIQEFYWYFHPKVRLIIKKIIASP